MEHTKGKAELSDANRNNFYKIGVKVGAYIICDMCDDGYDDDQQNANANLIIDAFNTTNESGLTPSQLYKQNQELLQALTAFIDGKEKNFEILATNARQAINNAKTK
jgi:hypothetical protein